MRAFTLLLSFATKAIAIRIFASPGSIPEAVPVRCRSALAQNITCDPFLVTGPSAANGDRLVDELAETYCTSSCSSSIESFRKNVETACGSNVYTLYENTTSQQSPQGIASGLSWAYSLMCLRDDAGFCLSDLYEDKKDDCSDCALKYGAAMLGSDFGRIRYSEDSFKSILSSCNAPASKYPWTYTPTGGSSAPPTSTTLPPAMASCEGTKYTVKAGDSCESISKVNSVATDRMIELNRLDYGCNTLTVGSTLCIPEQCETHEIKKDETCESIAEGQVFSVIHLQSWNPSISTMCNTKLVKNLDSLIGRSICISPPGGDAVPTISQTWTSHTRPTLASPEFTEWTTAKASTLDPGSTWDVFPTSRTSINIGTQTFTANPSAESRYLEARKYCWITEDDEFWLYDPSEQPGACQQLYSTYCDPEPTAPLPTASPRIPAVCTPDRSWYDDPFPEPVPTPRPHQPNMTKGCDKFYRVKSDDTCDSVAKTNGLKLSDLYTWNPDIGNDCRALQFDTWVCVSFNPRLVPTPRP